MRWESPPRKGYNSGKEYHGTNQYHAAKRLILEQPSPVAASELESRLHANLNAVQARIAAACNRAGREFNSVQLVAVTKAVGIDECRILHALGVTHMGENRIEIAAPKVEALGSAITWHMIGNIQRRKAREVVQIFDRVDAVDRLELAEALQRRLEGTDKHLPVLLEVNVSGEVSKHGFAPEDLPNALRDLGAFNHLQITGLMTMAPFDAPEPDIRAYFRHLKALTRDHGLPECSMGMTNDYEIAIEEGATQVRIGSALF